MFYLYNLFSVLYPKAFYAWVHVHLLLQSAPRNLEISDFRYWNMCIFNVAHKNYRNNISVFVEYMFVPFSREVIPVELSYLLFLYGVLP